MKVRIKNKQHLEEIFKHFAKTNQMDFSPDMIIEGNSELKFKDLMETCEIIGYENILIDDDFAENPKVFDMMYIDIVGIKAINFPIEKEYVWFLGGKTPEEINFEPDGTLRVWYD